MAAAQQKRKRKGTSVTLHGCRVQCSAERKEALQDELCRAREARCRWAPKAWKNEVKRVKGLNCWGAVTHGGRRTASTSTHDHVAVNIEALGSSAADLGALVGDPQAGPGTLAGDSQVDPGVVVGDPQADPGALVGPIDPETTTFSGKPQKPYIIQKQIGSGAYGSVYRAVAAHGGLLAIKLMRKEGLRAEPTLSMRREVAIMHQLAGKHPNILKLLGWRHTTFDVQLSLEHCDTDLHQYIVNSGDQINQGIARRFSFQMCSALAFVHGQGIIHRDVKSRNVLVKGESVKLGDFGMARRIGHAHGPPMSPDVCTITYRAPEIFLSHDCYGTPCDVWSLGLVVVEMEIHKPPFRSHTEIGMLFDIFTILGKPDTTAWPQLRCFPGYWGTFGRCPFPSNKPLQAPPWGIKFGDGFKSFVGALLQLPPQRRLSAESAAEHEWLAPARD